MKTHCLGSLLLITSFILGRVDPASVKAAENVVYTAAVLEYEPYNIWTEADQGYGVIRQNAKVILDYARQAKEQGADIMVTPEYGLQSLDMYDNEVDKYVTFTQLVPDPSAGINPCYFGSLHANFEGMQDLSCGASNYSLYLVIDLAEMLPCSNATIANAPWHLESTADCPASGYYFYNTQVVFNRKGTVIARYRKQHLFLEDAMTPGPNDDATALFVTDFDVLFSLQICFDIGFEHPGYSNIKEIGLRDVAMATAWVDYLPFELADAVQSAWSRGLGSNLLVAGHHLPESGKMGSGIYREYAKEPPVYIYDKDSGNVLLVANVTTVPASSFAAGPLKDIFKKSGHISLNQKIQNKQYTPVYSSVSEKARDHRMLHENLSNYSSVLLNRTASEPETVSACSSDNLCCDLTYTYTGDLNYMLLAYSGQMAVGYGRYYVGIQHCAVVWCKYNAVNTCAFVEAGLPATDEFGPFSISSSSFIVDSVYAAMTQRNLLLADYNSTEFANEGSLFTLSANEAVTDLMAADLVGRWYANDSV